MVIYLMRNNTIFVKLVAAIKDHTNLPLDGRVIETITRMLKKRGSDTCLEHPETLIGEMCRYLSEYVVWSILMVILEKHHPEFKVTDLETHCLEELASRDMRWNHQMTLGFDQAMWNLSRAELKRVKLLLSWEIVRGYGYIPYGQIEEVNAWDLSRNIVSKYLHHTVFVTSLIFTQIERMDLVEELILLTLRVGNPTAVLGVY